MICGFGRTGHYWGCETYGIQPDMLTCAKQLTAAYQPLSALLISDAIYAALLEGQRKVGSFGHGYTYGGHPVACAVALETLAIYEERDMVGHVQRVAPRLPRRAASALRGHPLVGEVRGVGLIAGVELMADKATKEPFPAGAKVGAAGAGEVPRGRPHRPRHRRPHRLHPAADHHRGRDRRDVRPLPRRARCRLGVLQEKQAVAAE